MSTTVEVPTNVLSTLLAGFVANAAARALESLPEEGRPGFLHSGDPFGRVLAWVWQLDHDRAMLLLADYIAELRDHGRDSAEVDPPVALEEVLRGLRFALPDGVSDYDQIVELARRKVPSLYGDPAV